VGGAEAHRADAVHLVSIELLRRMTDEMARPREFADRSYLASLPVGWYRTDFDAVVAGTDDVERASSLALVFDAEYAAYQALVTSLVSRAATLADSPFALPRSRWTTSAISSRPGRRTTSPRRC
jgi:hypothetical protein